VNESRILGQAINISRHLVNIPPNELYPATFADTIKDLFKDIPNVKVEIWDETRIAKENMTMLLAVGKASVHKPRFVQIRYNGGSKGKPIALVGKGVTFDSGGLDIKDAANMRLMKKDMGGAACLVGTAYWMAKSKYPRTCDFYLPMAENGVSGEAFRPSDVLTARNGMTVEIDNTDAEGRLILADAMCLGRPRRLSYHQIPAGLGGERSRRLQQLPPLPAGSDEEEAGDEDAGNRHANTCSYMTAGQSSDKAGKSRELRS
jgi:leucyl aminopeptidase